MDLSSGVETTFGKLFKDLRTAIDDIHLTSLKLKKAVIENPKRWRENHGFVTFFENPKNVGGGSFAKLW